MQTTFGQRLENLLDLSELPASELGLLAGMSHAVVGVLIAKDREKREQTPPKELQPAAKTVLGLARVLGCSFEYLADGTGEPPTEEQVKAAVEAARAARAEAAAPPTPTPTSESGEHPAVVEPTEGVG